MKRYAAELVLDAGAMSGEGPSWDSEAGVLWWVDIGPGRVHRFDPASGSDTVVEVGQPIGAVVPRASGDLLGALRDGFAFVHTGTGALEFISDVEKDVPGNRMNDGKCDAAGRFWAGTMAFDLTTGAGSLYRLDPDGTVTTMLKDVTISNGIAWSPDDATMYFIDSMAHGVDAMDFDLTSGEIANRRRLIDVPESLGLPDGLTVDEEGFLWVAVWQGHCVRRYAPDGTLDGIVEVPASKTTSCTFGGTDLADLWITSSAEDLSPDDARAQHAGGLFRCRPGVRGLPTNTFTG